MSQSVSQRGFPTGSSRFQHVPAGRSKCSRLSRFQQVPAGSAGPGRFSRYQQDPAVPSNAQQDSARCSKIQQIQAERGKRSTFQHPSAPGIISTCETSFFTLDRHGDEKEQHLHQIGTILLRECRDQIRDDKHFRAFVVNRTWGQYHPESGGLLPSIEDKFYLVGTMCDLVQGCGNILVHFAFERWCSLGDICQTTVQERVGRSTRRVDRNTKPRHPSEHQCKRSGRPSQS